MEFIVSDSQDNSDGQNCSEDQAMWLEGIKTTHTH